MFAEGENGEVLFCGNDSQWQQYKPQKETIRRTKESGEPMEEAEPVAKLPTQELNELYCGVPYEIERIIEVNIQILQILAVFFLNDKFLNDKNCMFEFPSTTRDMVSMLFQYWATICDAGCDIGAILHLSLVFAGTVFWKRLNQPKSPSVRGLCKSLHVPKYVINLTKFTFHSYGYVY